MLLRWFMMSRALTELEDQALRVLTERRRIASDWVETAELDAALHRLETATYGDCARCGGAIGRARLRAIPEAEHCLTCRTCPWREVCNVSS